MANTTVVDQTACSTPGYKSANLQEQDAAASIGDAATPQPTHTPRQVQYHRRRSKPTRELYRPRILRRPDMAADTSSHPSMPPTPPISPARPSEMNAGKHMSSHTERPAALQFNANGKTHADAHVARNSKASENRLEFPKANINLTYNVWGEPISAAAPSRAVQDVTPPESPVSSSLSPVDAAHGLMEEIQEQLLEKAKGPGSVWFTACSEKEDEDGLPFSEMKIGLSDQQVKHIHKWIALLPHKSTWDQPSTGFSVKYWMAPHQWMEYGPIGDEKLSLVDFWNKFYHGKRVPDCGSRFIDPWWTQYLNETAAPFIHCPRQPDVTMDPTDRSYHLGKSYHSTAEHKINAMGSNSGSGPSLQPCQHVSFKPKRYSVIANNNQNRNPYRKPPVNPAYQGKANMYLRLAAECDSQQLRDIYNHFVENTWYVPEKKALSLEQMRDRLREVQAGGWPWLVAVERSTLRLNGRRKNRRGDADHDFATAGEKIMGFAYACDHIAADSTDHVTAQVHFWVLPECQNSKVGTTLMDRLLFCLLADHEPITDAEYRVTTEPFNTAGGCKRTVHSLLASMQYAPKGEDETRANIVLGFLSRYGFDMYGEQREVGWRKNRYLNRKLFQRICVENADGAHSDMGAEWDTDSITRGEPRYFRPEDDTFDKREERRLAAVEARCGDKTRPLPQDWKPVVRR